MSVTADAVALPMLAAIPGLRYTVSTRDAARPLGGDMSFSTGREDPDGVVANRTWALSRIGATLANTVMCGLVHGTAVVPVTASDAGRGVRDPTSTIPDTDALITNTPALTLGMCFADCTPLILVDPVRRAIGLGHAGWRGTLAGMPTAMVHAMRKAYASDPADLRAVIGPAIGPDVYEVGADVADPFAHAFADTPVVRPHPEKPGKWLLNLWMANAVQFTQAGVPEESVAISGICTLTHGDRFFSHRFADAHTEREGRFAVFVSM